MAVPGTSANPLYVKGNSADAISVERATAAAASLANVDSATSSTTLKAANTDRVGLIVFNDDENPLKLKYGSAASATSFTYEIAGGGTWEMPEPVYTGIVTGIWDADGTGAARVTELT